MKDLPIKKAEKIIKHYGTAHQKIKLCEECAELIQAVCKSLDNGSADNITEDMIEEMADVQIMLIQFRHILPNYQYDRLYEIQRQKLDRQLKRIESEVHNDS
jgi:NTP pyrophosphatase (non-canonical NTP hydrolase)